MFSFIELGSRSIAHLIPSCARLVLETLVLFSYRTNPKFRVLCISSLDSTPQEWIPDLQQKRISNQITAPVNILAHFIIITPISSLPFHSLHFSQKFSHSQWYLTPAPTKKVKPRVGPPWPSDTKIEPRLQRLFYLTLMLCNRRHNKRADILSSVVIAKVTSYICSFGSYIYIDR